MLLRLWTEIGSGNRITTTKVEEANNAHRVYKGGVTYIICYKNHVTPQKVMKSHTTY